MRLEIFTISQPIEYISLILWSQIKFQFNCCICRKLARVLYFLYKFTLFYANCPFSIDPMKNFCHEFEDIYYGKTEFPEFEILCLIRCLH